MNPFASYYVLVCIKQMFLYQEKYTSDDGRTLSKYVMCVIWKYLTNVCLFNKISQSDQTMKISLKLPARCGGEPGDHKTKYEISILLTDLKLGRECMPAVQTLLGCGIFLKAIFGGEHRGSIRVDHDRREQKQILVKILLLFHSMIVDLSSKWHKFCLWTR